MVDNEVVEKLRFLRGVYYRCTVVRGGDSVVRSLAQLRAVLYNMCAIMCAHCTHSYAHRCAVVRVIVSGLSK